MIDDEIQSETEETEGTDDLADASEQPEGFVYKEDESEKSVDDTEKVEDFKNVDPKERIEMSEEDIATIMDLAFPKK